MNLEWFIGKTGKLNAYRIKSYEVPASHSWCLSKPESIYAELNKIYSPKICKSVTCNNKVTFHSFPVGYKTFCSHQCSNNDSQVQNKQTLSYRSNLEMKKTAGFEVTKENVSNFYNGSKLIGSKVRTLNIPDEFGFCESKSEWLYCVKHGKSTPNKCQACSNKASFQDGKYLIFCGNKCANNSDSSKEKTRASHKKNCGYNHPLQNADVFEEMKTHSNFFKTTNFTMPSGRIIQLQGQEPLVLMELLNSYDEIEIETDSRNMPEFWYTMNNNKHRYYPDFWIPSTQTVIEVKSDYTLNKEIVSGVFPLKQKSVEDKKYIFTLIVK